MALKNVALRNSKGWDWSHCKPRSIPACSKKLSLSTAQGIPRDNMPPATQLTTCSRARRDPSSNRTVWKALFRAVCFITDSSTKGWKYSFESWEAVRGEQRGLLIAPKQVQLSQGSSSGQCPLLRGAAAMGLKSHLAHLNNQRIPRAKKRKVGRQRGRGGT